jgi:hypothetical protein
LNSFERVPVPRVTEHWYGLNNNQRGWRCEGRNLVTGTLPNVSLKLLIIVVRMPPPRYLAR